MEMYDNHLLDNMVEKANLIDESTEEIEVIDLQDIKSQRQSSFHIRENRQSRYGVIG